MSSKFFGFNLPILAGRTILPFQTDERLIKNDILQLLLTSPGERIMHPDFGCPIRSMMFDQNTQDNRDFIKERIYEAISRYEKRVSIRQSDVIVETDKSNENVINIIIRCNYTPQNFDNSFEIRFNINISTGKIERAITG